jgi:cell division protein FtsB
VTKVAADTYVPPATRRWSTRLVLAIIVAIFIAYVPGQVMRRDPRTVKLERQLVELDTEARTLRAQNADLAREIEALRTSVGAIEDRARADLGMVYPDEIVLRVERPAGGAP